MRLIRPLTAAVLVAAVLSLPQPAQAAVFKHAVHNKTGTLYVWNGRNANKFGPAIPISSGWAPYF